MRGLRKLAMWWVVGDAPRPSVARGQRDNDLIEHILDAAGKLAEIVAAGRAAFDDSWLVRSAAERQLEIIGEAAGKLSERLVSGAQTCRSVKLGACATL